MNIWHLHWKLSEPFFISYELNDACWAADILQILAQESFKSPVKTSVEADPHF